MPTISIPYLPTEGAGCRAPLLPLAYERVARAKSAYSVRRIDLSQATRLLAAPACPRPGDVVLARVDQLGQHTRLESALGRKAALYVGDEIVVCYGNRYATDQFEAEVPPDLGPCQLVAGGGIAAAERSRHGTIRAATAITPIGLLADATGRRLNLADFALPVLAAPRRRPPITAVLGTSMNAGKTTTVAGLIRGLTHQGRRVGAAKVTGTGSGGDIWSMIDAGAAKVLDFTDAGHASTFGLNGAALQATLGSLVAHLCHAGVDVILLEIADGLVQQETAELVTTAAFRDLVDDIVFAAGDAMGALAGVEWLRRHDLPVAAVAGLVTASPLARREAGAVVGLPVIGLEALRSGAWLPATAAHRIRREAAE